MASHNVYTWRLIAIEIVRGRRRVLGRYVSIITPYLAPPARLGRLSRTILAPSAGDEDVSLNQLGRCPLMLVASYHGDGARSRGTLVLLCCTAAKSTPF
jgi:hypothetical protein